MIDGLEPLSTCADSAALLARVGPPLALSRRMSRKEVLA
jgi:hypothetical protein